MTKKTQRMKATNIEFAKVMCWECRDWIEHNKCHYCPAAKPIVFYDWTAIYLTLPGL